MQYINESNPLFHVAKMYQTMLNYSNSLGRWNTSSGVDNYTRCRCKALAFPDLQINLNRLGGPDFSDM